MVVMWHLLDPPRSEIGLQAALPLAGVSASRIYLGLPMSGQRLPEGGLEAFFQMGYQDAVLKQFDPIVRGGRTALARHLVSADLVEIPEMGHAFAEEPGIEPAPQTQHAARVDDVVVEWLQRHASGGGR